MNLLNCYGRRYMYGLELCCRNLHNLSGVPTLYAHTSASPPGSFSTTARAHAAASGTGIQTTDAMKSKLRREARGHAWDTRTHECSPTRASAALCCVSAPVRAPIVGDLITVAIRHTVVLPWLRSFAFLQYFCNTSRLPVAALTVSRSRVRYACVYRTRADLFARVALRCWQRGQPT